MWGLRQESEADLRNLAEPACWYGTCYAEYREPRLSIVLASLRVCRV